MSLIDNLVKDLKAVSEEFGRGNIVILLPKEFKKYSLNYDSRIFSFCTDKSIEFIVKGYTLHYKRELTSQEMQEFTSI